MHRLPLLLFIITGTLSGIAPTRAQDFGIPGFSSFGGNGSGKKIQFSAEFKALPDGSAAELSVTATLDPGWHIYSTTQGPGGPKKTSFVLSTAGVEFAGDAKPDHEPQKNETSEYGDPITEEYFHDEVTWTIPVRLPANADVKSLKIEGDVSPGRAKPGDTILIMSNGGFDGIYQKLLSQLS